MTRPVLERAIAILRHGIALAGHDKRLAAELQAQIERNTALLSALPRNA